MKHIFLNKSSGAPIWNHLKGFGLLLLLLHFCLQAPAQVTTKPLLYFPLDESSSTNNTIESGTYVTRMPSLPPGTITDIQMVARTQQAFSFVDNRFGISYAAAKLDASSFQRLQVEYGSSLSTSFFGTNTATGHDVDKFTISCWVYVNLSNSKQRYIFYGQNSSNELGFALSFRGPDLYLTKYINNATPAKGAKLTPPVIGNSWECKFYGPATFDAGTGWYHVILVQAEYYTRLFVGRPPTWEGSDWQETKGTFDIDFVGSMFMHGKQDLSSFTKWGVGLPEGTLPKQSSSDPDPAPVRRISDFLLFDYDMSESEAEALYRCQVTGPTEQCLGSGQTFTENFAIIGDYGCDGGTADNIASGLPDVATMVKSWNPNFILTVGDDSYHDAANRGCSTDIDKNVGKYYRDYIYPYTSNNGYTRTSGSPSVNRYFPVMGNHDDNCINGEWSFGTYNCSGRWENYFPTQNYSSTSNVNTTSGNGRYYTFQQDNIQFFAVNANAEEPDGNTATSTQANWLKSALAASTATFKIVYMHQSPYSSYNASAEGSRGPQQEMKKWPFKEWGADIVISGDDHYYERNEYKNLTYIVNGVGGMPTFPSIDTDRIVAGNRVHIEQKFGAVRVDYNTQGDVLHFRFYGIDPANRSTNTVMDEFYLYKRSSGATYLVEQPAELERLRAEARIPAQELTAYPNPTKGDLNIRWYQSTSSPVDFTIRDLSGRSVWQQKDVYFKGNQELTIDDLKTKGIVPGVYFLQLRTTTENQLVKVVVQ